MWTTAEQARSVSAADVSSVMENSDTINVFPNSGYSNYIVEQMAKARAAVTPEERFRAIANVLAANGLWIRTADIDNASGQTQPLNHAAIEKISVEICTDKGFRILMFYSVYVHPDAGNPLDRLTNHPHGKAESLKNKEPDQTALEAILAIQQKVKAGTETPEDYAKLIAVHHLSGWTETGIPCGADGEKTEAGRGADRIVCGGMAVEKERRDLNRRLDGGQIRMETERVMRDPDFQYLMKHESRALLRLNALRMYGIGFCGYAGRVRQLQMAERETALSGKTIRGGTGRDRVMPNGQMKRAPPVFNREASAAFDRGPSVAAVSGGIGKSGGPA